MRGVFGVGFIGSLAAVMIAVAAGGSGPARASTADVTPAPVATAAAGSAVVPAQSTGRLASGTTPGWMSVGGIPFRFRAFPLRVRELTVSERPFYGSRVIPKVDSGLHDADGVRMRRVRGQLYEFPRGQASYGLDNLNAYRLTGDQFYLDRALAQANRLLSYHDEGGEAWYYPNYPSKYRHGRPGEFIQAPYYSALPQGRVLMLFARLAEMTGSSKWSDAARHPFLAFLRPGPRRGPYFVDLDSHGYYWLQEWPWAGMQPDCTLNGHNSSSFGLFDYYLSTGDERAKALFQAAATTIKHYLPQFRRRGWISCYCLAHRGAHPTYHNMHVGQLLALYRMTGDVCFARAADAFSNDYPKPDVRGGLRVEPGTYNLVRVGASGTVTARRTIVVTRTSTWRATSRKRLWRGSPIFLRASTGRAAGWWIPEREGRVRLIGFAAAHSYSPPRTLTVAAGVTCVAVAFDARGHVTSKQRVEAGDGLRLAADRRAVVDGYARVRLDGGELDGYWLRLRRGVRLR
jgi:hypothetical protein